MTDKKDKLSANAQLKDGLIAARCGNVSSETIFWILAIIITVCGLWSKTLFGSEGRWAEVSRNMLLTGDFFHPIINGVTYFDKPLLSYWTIVAIANIVGGVLNEFIMRLPSVLLGLVGLWATMALAKMLFSRKIALLSGYIMLSSYGFLIWTRTAAADIQNMTVVILAVYWFFKRKEQPNFITYALFYLILALGAQFKGLPAAVVPCVVIAPYLIREKRWLKHLKFSHVMAILLGLTVYLAPFVIAAESALPVGYTRQSGGGPENSRGGEKIGGLRLVYQENIRRFFASKDHIQPFYAYFKHIPKLLLPWSIIFIFSLAAFLRNYNTLSPNSRWLTESVVAIFLLFSLSSSKRWYYILPILPFCSILMANFIYHRGWLKAKRWAIGLTTIPILLIAVGEVATPALYAVKKLRPIAKNHELIISFMLCGLTILLLWHFRKRLTVWGGRTLGVPPYLVPLLLSIYIMLLGFFGFQEGALEHFRTYRAFTRAIKTSGASLPCRDIAFFKKVNPSILFYLQTMDPVTILDSPQAVTEFLKKPRGLFISQHRYLRGLPAPLADKILSQATCKEKIYPWEKPKKKLVLFKLEQ